MKDNIQRILIIYCVVISGLCVWLMNENETKEQRLNEEIEIKYEYSVIIDSLIEEEHNNKHWYEMTEEEINQKLNN